MYEAALKKGLSLKRAMPVYGTIVTFVKDACKDRHIRR
jgi:hypothetical protein